MEVGGTIMGCFDDAAKAAPFVLDKEPSKFRSGASQPSPDTYFDCSICLDFAAEPVVTLCGHLYCWPCIYKWLKVETASPQQCPVCKAPISQNALVPLYGRGLTSKGSDKSLSIPSRSSILRDSHSSIAPMIEDHHFSNSTNYRGYMDQQPVQNHRRSHHQHYPYSNGGGNYTSSSSFPLQFGTGACHSMFGLVLRDIMMALLPWLSRNHHGGGMPSSSPHHLLFTNGNSPSQRRQEMRIENSLHQLWGFLFFCAVLCLFFF